LAETDCSANQKARYNSLNFHVYGVCEGRENPKSYKRWVDHFPSVYRLSHA
jgi:hypothetical protein